MAGGGEGVLVGEREGARACHVDDAADAEADEDGLLDLGMDLPGAVGLRRRCAQVAALKLGEELPERVDQPRVRFADAGMEGLDEGIER